MDSFSKVVNKNEPKNNTVSPNLELSKIGIVARDYRVSNSNSDFSDNISEVLKKLDNKGCDTALFSLYTILESNSISVEKFNEFKNLKAVFIEEFKEMGGDETCFKVYFKKKESWKIHEFTQKFAKLEYTNKFKQKVIEPFLKEVKTKRILGNSMVLLCGETNIVKYSKKSKSIEDIHGLLKIIPPSTNIILNPVHDKMTRFEMKLKRKFLSKNNRIVISVWNKGKIFKNGKTRDGINPPWTVYFNEKEIQINKEDIKIHNDESKIDIGIIDVKEITTAT